MELCLDYPASSHFDKTSLCIQDNINVFFMWPSLCLLFAHKYTCVSYQKKPKQTFTTLLETGGATEIFATKACWPTHKHTHTTHQGSAGRWEEHRGERDGRSLGRPLSPHHPASPSQQERALNQRSKREEGSEGRERGKKEGERERESRKRQMQNELMRGTRGSRVLKRSHEMNDVVLLDSYLVFLAASYASLPLLHHFI